MSDSVRDMGLLAICIPTYQRAGELEGLLENLAAEIGTREDVCVLVSDNASTDATPEVLARFAAEHPWLQCHRQPENLGAVGNMDWLVENAPDCEYVWSFGDDDRILPGGLGLAADLLAAESPSWLFLPHRWVSAQGEPAGGSPAPETVERYAAAGDLFMAWHHWTTFLSASIVRRDALRDAVRATQTENAYSPLLWFFRAGLNGPCVVAPGHIVAGSLAISWADRAHIILTQHFTGLYDDGLHLGLTQEQFGATLDGLYATNNLVGHWSRHPIERLAATVERFPQSAALRAYLWTLARHHGNRDVLGVLAASARAVGAEAVADEQVAAGETAFAAGNFPEAVRLFGDALRHVPTHVTAWSDLAVALHAQGLAEADAAIESALFIAPADVDALLNRASMRLASGSPAGAAADVSQVLAVDPGNAAALRLLELADAALQRAA